MKKLLALLTLILAISLQPSAFSQFGYTMLCDSNGILATNFYVPFAQVTGYGTNSLFSNLVYGAQLNLATNAVATNAAAQTLAVSNYFANSFNLIDGLGNVALPGTTATNNVMLGGQTNMVAAYSNQVLLGGDHNSLAEPGSFIIGGENNFITWAGQNSGILGGSNNALIASSSVIVGGIYNNLGWSSSTKGTGNVILGGATNTIQRNNSIVGGTGAFANHDNVFIWSDSQGLTNTFTSTAANQYLIRAAGGVGINTNNPGSNAFAITGNLDATSMSMGGTNLFTLFSFTAATNALSQQWNYNLNVTSNGIAAQLGSNAIAITATSNSLVLQLGAATTAITSSSNALAAQIVVNSNIVGQLGADTTNNLITFSNQLYGDLTTVSNQIVRSKAFSTYIPASYSSIGVAFATPLMPDGNYSVSLTPQDQTTAQALLAGMTWWVQEKNNSGFKIYVPFATNNFNLNFDCQVKENSQ